MLVEHERAPTTCSCENGKCVYIIIGASQSKPRLVMSTADFPYLPIYLYTCIYVLVTSLSDYTRLSCSYFIVKLHSSKSKHIHVALLYPMYYRRVVRVGVWMVQDPDNNCKARKIACSVEESTRGPTVL